MDLWLYFSLVLLQSTTRTFSFNFETRLPVIKKGGIGTYFGFSVAEHQYTDGNDNQMKNVLLVGAPLDQNRQPNTNRSGALWSCPITTYDYDCDQVVTDGKTDVDDEELVPPMNDEIKDGQWLGVTVRSEGTDGKVLVCAHRYIKGGTEYVHGRGLCYTLTKRLEHSDSIDPCKGRPTNSAHEQFGYCQAGTSGLITNDILVVGSPGPYTWRGTVFVLSVLDDFLSRDKTMYYSPVTEETAPINKYSYLGMSVAAADFFGQGLAYAAGAPRSNGTGQVIIFTKVKPAVTLMKPEMTLTGEMYTSNFGYEMTTADVNGDKRPDLIVGAPNYFDKNEGGAVYIFLNLNNECSLKCVSPLKITGQPESRFGISITNLGDINKDGFEDIAVGAPYEGNGTVYIYLGSKNGTIPEPSQIIDGSDYNLETFGYSVSGGLDMDNNGYPDLMIGAFESSSIVLLRTRPIIELKTTVQPETALTRIDPNKNGCQQDPHSNLTCFTFEACVFVTAVMKNRLLAAGTGLRLKYELRVDVNRRIPRAFIGPEFIHKPPFINREIHLRQDSGEFKHCHSNTVYIKDDTKDIQSAIAMRLSYKMLQEEPIPPKPGEPLPKMDHFPILNQQQADRLVRATFLKDCGDNDICESQLNIDAKLDLPITKPGSNKWNLILGELKEFLLNVTVHNLQESAYESYLVIKHSPSLSYIAQLKGKSHSCERNSEMDVVCPLGNPLERNAEAKIILRFEPLASVDEVREVKFELTANTTSQLVESEPTKTLIAKIIKKAKLSIHGSVRPEEVTYGGKVRGESEMKFKDQPGSRIKHIYEVYNKGPSHVNDLEVHFDWPFQVANNKRLGKWLLYLDEEPSVEAEDGGKCFTHPGQVNPLGLSDKITFLGGQENGNIGNSSSPAGPPYTRLRKRRDVEMIVKKDSDNVVRMNCKSGTAKCIKFHCIFHKLRASHSATVTIKARLWNSTLVEDYPRVRAAEIASNAKINIKGPGLLVTSKPEELEAKAVTVAKVGGFPDQQAAEGVELWIILVAVVSGILVFLLVALLLWKLGFFKRTRPDPTLSGNLEKHNDDFDY